MVGTDGGASTVREQLGIGMSGTPALTYTTNVMFRCKNFSELHDKGKGYRFIFIGPEGIWLTIVAVNGADRFRMSIVGTPQKINHSEDDIRAALKRAMGRDFDYEILSVMRWVRRELVADRYGTDRIFIAGDAAHLMSPTGGFGMNTGIGDAVDLGWKLEAAVKGWGGADLLASYDAERRPVGLRNVAEASRNLRRMLSTRERLPGPEIFQPGAANDAARKEYGDWFAAIMRHEWFANGVMLGYRYDNSPIVWPDGTPAPPDQSHPYIQTARPGARAPACLARATAARRSTCSAAASCCCGSAPIRRRGADRARRASSAACRSTASRSTSRTCSPPTSAAWCWCGPTATSPGAPTRSPPMPSALIDVVRGQANEVKQQKLGRNIMTDKLREKLINGGRVLVDEGQGDYVWGHISARLPDDPNRFLMKPGCVGIEEMTDDNIITVEHRGRQGFRRLAAPQRGLHPLRGDAGAARRSTASSTPIPNMPSPSPRSARSSRR